MTDQESASWRLPAFSAALTTNILSFFVGFGALLFIAQYLQLVLGLSPLQAGLWMLPSSAAFILGSMLTPLVVPRVRPVVVMAGGLVLAAAGSVLLARLEGASGLAVLVTGSVVFSLGLAPVDTLAADLTVAAAPRERAGAASAISETGAEFGGALGIAILGVVGTAAYRAQVANAVPAGIPTRAASAARATLGGAAAAAEQLPAPLDKPCSRPRARRSPRDYTWPLSSVPPPRSALLSSPWSCSEVSDPALNLISHPSAPRVPQHPVLCAFGPTKAPDHEQSLSRQLLAHPAPPGRGPGRAADPSSLSPGPVEVDEATAASFGPNDAVRLTSGRGQCQSEPAERGRLAEEMELAVVSGRITIAGGEEYLVLQPSDTADPFSVTVAAGAYTAESFSVNRREAVRADTVALESSATIRFSPPQEAAGPAVLYLKRVGG